jgi:IclR family transcriptional regulator, acetate operon repressor
MLVKQISNLFSLMEFFVRAEKPLSVRDIVEEFSWPRSSVFNMVSTMVEHGYLYQPVPRGGYYPTSKWMDLARDLSESRPLPESVHELLVELMEQTGETLILAAPEGTSVAFLDVVESPAVIRYIANVGQRIPIHVTAAGRAILSQYSPQERAATLKRITYQRYGRGAFMTPESVEQDIQESAKDGWYVNLETYADGLGGIAVPFPFLDRRNAVVLGAPVSRVEQRVASMGKLLRESVDRFLKENEAKERRIDKTG